MSDEMINCLEHATHVYDEWGQGCIGSIWVNCIIKQ